VKGLAQLDRKFYTLSSWLRRRDPNLSQDSWITKHNARQTIGGYHLQLRLREVLVRSTIAEEEGRLSKFESADLAIAYSKVDYIGM
jgi:hypothetical protein